MSQCNDSGTPDAIVMCTHPHGTHEHVDADSATGRSGTCFYDCPCTPRKYVAVDALLSDDEASGFHTALNMASMHGMSGDCVDALRARVDALSVALPGTEASK